MAFRRSYARRTSRRRVTRRPRRSARRTVRRPIGRRSIMRRTSTRRILNIASTKKQDNMISFVTNAAGVPTSGVGRYGLAGDQVGQFVWCATARDRIGTGDATATSLRNSDVCYMRGLKEKILISTTGGSAWRWRRICFTAKGLVPPSGTVDSLEVSPNGWVRLMANQWTSALGNGFNSLIFKGTAGLDWTDVFTAKVDTSRVTIKFDKTFVVSSGNANGIVRNFNLWHPMNQNLVYDNDENGESEINSTRSTSSKAGMGDYYVIDYFVSVDASASQLLYISPQATLYWHEK